MSSPVNETLIRDIISEVLGRLGSTPAPKSGAAPAPSPTTCGCNGHGKPAGGIIGRGKFGVFQDAKSACEAAHEAYLQLQQKGVAARSKIVEIIKGMADSNAAEWG